MNVTANLDGGFELEQIRLLKENISRSDSKLLDFTLGKLNLLAWPG
uniref:Serine/threonine-protein phosphatase PP1 isozyme 4-like n=1 Tax=Rhizophora mucronata TaxID=61149 RepID=A0A2P2J2R1_RHIMU